MLRDLSILEPSFANWELNYRISKMGQKCDFELLSEKCRASECASFSFYFIFLSQLNASQWRILDEKLSYLHGSTIVSPNNYRISMETHYRISKKLSTCIVQTIVSPWTHYRISMKGLLKAVYLTGEWNFIWQFLPPKSTHFRHAFQLESGFNYEGVKNGKVFLAFLDTGDTIALEMR